MKITPTLLILILLLLPSAVPAQDLETPSEIPSGVREFEDSLFCRKNGCHLKSIEPLRFRFPCTYSPGRPPRYPQFTLLINSD